MRAHILQHVPFEGIGSIQSWLTARAATVGFTRFYESTGLPDVKDIDLVIAMGGPMSVNDETDLPWLREEKRFIRDAIQADKAVVGICLGAQLIASALGSRVSPGRKEIGWFNIEATSRDAGLFRFPEVATVFHWHGETFDLPSGATRLARSAACENQAFQIRSTVIGLQFHLETTPASADLIIRNCRHELADGPYVQTEQAMRATPDTTYAAVNRLMGEVLSHVTKSIDTTAS